MFQKIHSAVGIISGHAVNKYRLIKKRVSKEILNGYDSVIKEECAWCKRYFNKNQITSIGEKRFLMCGYCLEGLAAAEAMLGNIINKDNFSVVIDTMLEEARREKNPQPTGYNNFIAAANEVNQRLFSAIGK